MSKVIPSYASDYPKEFLVIKGIEKCFKYFIVRYCRYEILETRVIKINKYLEFYDKEVSMPIEIRYDDLKKYIVHRVLLEDIKGNFDFYVGYGMGDVDDIDFYYPGFTKLYNTIKRFRSKIIFRGKDNSPYEIVDPYIPCGF